MLAYWGAKKMLSVLGTVGLQRGWGTVGYREGYGQDHEQSALFPEGEFRFYY